MATTAQVANAIASGINTSELFNSVKTSYLNNASNVALSNSITTMVHNSPFFAQLNVSGVLAANASADSIATAVRGMFANSPYFSYFNNSLITALGD
jgi:hypothetical protein